jgi:hypothetical protein
MALSRWMSLTLEHGVRGRSVVLSRHNGEIPIGIRLRLDDALRLASLLEAKEPTDAGVEPTLWDRLSTGQSVTRKVLLSDSAHVLFDKAPRGPTVKSRMLFTWGSIKFTPDEGLAYTKRCANWPEPHAGLRY